MLPVILKIGPLTIYSFGVMLALAFIVPTHLYGKELARRGLDPELASIVMTWAIVGGLIGARVYYLIEFWEIVRRDLWGAMFSGSGLVAYGGFAGGILMSWLALRRSGAPVIRCSDACAPMLALGYAIGRVGCLLAGDGDYGPPSTLPWAISFPHGVVPTFERVHPTPLYEMAMMLIVFTVLYRLRTRPWPVGRLFALYLCLQGVERFVAEFWRLNPKWVGGLSGAQIISLAALVVGVAWLLRLRGRPAAEALA